MLKLYEFNPPAGWRGCMVCIAASKQEAFEIFSKNPMIFDKHETLASINEHEIKTGLVIENFGDL